IGVSGAVLTLEANTVISGGTLTGESTPSSELLITTAASPVDGASAGGATLDDVTVTDNNLIEVSGATLTLTDATSISGGSLTVGAGAHPLITSPSGAALHCG